MIFRTGRLSVKAVLRTRRASGTLYHPAGAGTPLKPLHSLHHLAPHLLPPQGKAVPGSELVPASIANGLSVAENTLVLLAITVGTRLLAYASIEVGARLKLI